MPDRQEVYRVIYQERDYQKNLGPERTDGDSHTVGDYLVMLDTYLRRAKDAWTGNPGVIPSLREVRKIAAIAVRCMEEHGAIERF